MSRLKPRHLATGTALALLAALAQLPGSPALAATANQAASTPKAPMEALTEATAFAIRNGDIDKALALIARGVDTKAAPSSGETLLHDAVVFSGDKALIAALLRAGAPVRARNSFGETPLQAALSYAQYQHQPEGGARMLVVAEQLLAAGASLDASDADGRPLLLRVMEWRHPPLLQRLLQRGLPMPDDALLQALRAAGDAEGLGNAKLLFAAAQPRHLKARDDQGKSTAHLAAAQRELLPLLQRLAERGADLKAIDAGGQTVFAAAAFAANLPALQWLAERGALSLQADADGHTPLHLASYEPRPEVLRWLRERGADLNARDRRGRRALDIAIANERFAWRSPAEKLVLVELLGGGPADVLRGRYAEHPLDMAIRKKDLKLVESLLKQGADANVRDASGHTPLWAAIDACSWPASVDFGRKLLPLLLRYGADPRRTVNEHEDETYIDLARRSRVLDLLEREMSRHSPLR